MRGSSLRPLGQKPTPNTENRQLILHTIAFHTISLSGSAHSHLCTIPPGLSCVTSCIKPRAWAHIIHWSHLFQDTVSEIGPILIAPSPRLAHFIQRDARWTARHTPRRGATKLRFKEDELAHVVALGAHSVVSVTRRRCAAAVSVLMFLYRSLYRNYRQQ